MNEKIQKRIDGCRTCDGTKFLEDGKPFDKKRQKFLVKSDYIIKKKLMYHLYKLKIKVQIAQEERKENFFR